MRLLSRIPLFCWRGVSVLTAIAVLSGCGTAPPPAGESASKAPPRDAMTEPLRVGDHVKITIIGTPETIDPSEQEIKDDGTVNIPLIGRIQAAGKSPGQLEKDIQDALVPKFYAHASVTVSATARFFYIGGEVNQNSSGGRIMISGPMTLTGAIDAAGGFSPFANKRNVRLTRVNGTVVIVNCRRAVLHPEEDPPVYPGDRIYIRRRF
jgi:protein involved in polysaccharide export with SLBB domain